MPRVQKGDTGPAGPTGAAGPTDATGAGVPPGGTAGQVMKKIDSTDFNIAWQNDSTDSITEGTSNLYFTAARVLATVLTGLSTATSSPVAATDNILNAIGKLQAYINTIYSGLAINNTGLTAGTYLNADGRKVIKGTGTTVDGTANFTSIDLFKIWFNNLTGGWQQIVPNDGTLSGNLIAKLPNKTGTQTFAMLSDISSASGSSIPAANTNAQWDSSKNMSANSFIPGYATTVSANTNTILTVASAPYQFITGTTGQSVTLPVVSTLVLGQMFQITNNSTGTTTIQSSGGTSIVALIGGQTAILTCIAITGTSAASWTYYLVGSNTASLSTPNTWTALQSMTNGLTVSGGNLSSNGVIAAQSGVYSTQKAVCGYQLNGYHYGAIGNVNGADLWGLGYNSNGVGNSFTSILQWDTLGPIALGPFRLMNYTVSTLPSATTGMVCYVTDASSPTIGSAVIGGGTAKAMVWYNGYSWTVTGS